MERVTSLPLVSSTYGLVSSVYSNTKSTHPYIRSVCEAAEQGVWTITSVALTTASPIIDKLEPQSKSLNSLPVWLTSCHTGRASNRNVSPLTSLLILIFHPVFCLLIIKVKWLKLVNNLNVLFNHHFQSKSIYWHILISCSFYLVFLIFADSCHGQRAGLQRSGQDWEIIATSSPALWAGSHWILLHKLHNLRDNLRSAQPWTMSRVSQPLSLRPLPTHPFAVIILMTAAFICLCCSCACPDCFQCQGCGEQH